MNNATINATLSPDNFNTLKRAQRALRKGSQQYTEDALQVVRELKSRMPLEPALLYALEDYTEEAESLEPRAWSLAASLADIEEHIHTSKRETIDVVRDILSAHNATQETEADAEILAHSVVFYLDGVRVNTSPRFYINCNRDALQVIGDILYLATYDKQQKEAQA